MIENHSTHFNYLQDHNLGGGMGGRQDENDDLYKKSTQKLNVYRAKLQLERASGYDNLGAATLSSSDR